MRVVGRAAVWIAILLLVLSAISWAGIVLVAPYFFLAPAIALVVLIGFVTIVAGSQRKKPANMETGPQRSRHL